MTTAVRKQSTLRIIITFLVIFLVAKPIQQLLTQIAGASFLSDPNLSHWIDIVFLFSFIVFILAILLVVKVVERRKCSDLELVWNSPGFGIFFQYFILGFLLVTSMVLIFNLLGIYQWKAFGSIQPIYLGISLLAYCIQGFAKELLIRGYVHNGLEKNHGFIVAIIVNTICFSAPHLLTIENVLQWPTLVVLANLICISVIFTQVMKYKQSLWAAIGFHVSWNYTLSVLSGIAVSGLRPYSSLFEFDIQSDTILVSGGAYGLEGSILLLPILLLICIILQTKINKKVVQ